MCARVCGCASPESSDLENCRFMRSWRCSILTGIARRHSLARRAAVMAQVSLSRNKRHALHSRIFMVAERGYPPTLCCCEL
eukprot:11107100-Alexandrium_andersonii.AAC.1